MKTAIDFTIHGKPSHTYIGVPFVQFSYYAIAPWGAEINELARTERDILRRRYRPDPERAKVLLGII